MDARWAAYFYPNTEVLKNKFDITDKELKEYLKEPCDE